MDFRIYVQLTSFEGKIPIRLVSCRADSPDLEEIYSTSHVVQFRGKLIVEQLLVVWKDFQFPAPGEYVFQLWGAGQCIAERRLTARIKGD